MIFIPENADDISRYYKNTYVKFREFGDKLFYIKGVNNKVVTGVDEDDVEFELFLNSDYPYEVDYVLPKKSCFQHKNHAYILRRVPAKQYQRGISSTNTQMFFVRKNTIVETSFDFDVLKSYVNKKAFPSLNQALTKVGKNISVALSPRFLFVPHTRLIYVDIKAIAEVDHTTKTIEVYQKVFLPEVQTLANNSIFQVK